MDSAMNFSTNTNNESKLCAKCNNTATKACSACRGAPNSEGTLAVTTWYCSAECQTTDRAAHKDICKAREARKILYRAGSTAQAAFAKYREEMFDKSLKAVNRKGKSIVLVDNYYKTEDIIFPFPSALFPDSGEKQAVLMFMTCNDAYFVMHNSIKMLLKGIYSKFENVMVRPQNRAYHLTCLSPNGYMEKNEGGHHLLKVTLKGGQHYSLDITGAQFGFFDSILPWDHYVARRIQSIEKRMDFGHALEAMDSMCKEAGWMGRVARMTRAATQAMDIALTEWIKDNGITLAATLKLPEAQYLSKRTEMLDTIGRALRSFKDGNEDLMRPKREVVDDMLAFRHMGNNVDPDLANKDLMRPNREEGEEDDLMSTLRQMGLNVDPSFAKVIDMRKL